jgi:DNA-binding beta-propeller fold protein YncE
MAPLYSLPRPTGMRLDPTRNLYLDSRSGSLITAGKYQMALPTTDAELVAQGWPSIVANAGELWLCDEAAGNLVGEINGYQLAPQNAPLQSRDFQGLPYGGNLWAKKAVEPASANGTFRASAAAEIDIALEDFTISLLLRMPPSDRAIGWSVIGKVAAVGWHVYIDNTWFYLHILDVSGDSYIVGASAPWDGALHLLTFSCDRDGRTLCYRDNLATVNNASQRPGTLSNVTLFTLGATFGLSAQMWQYAWAMINIGVAASRVGHDALWAALSSNHLGTANTYTRTNPLTYPIAASRVATAAANMLPVGYNANFVAGTDNTEKLGIPCEDGISFLPIGSDNFFGNIFNLGGSNLSSVDGCSGMRDGVRTSMTAAFNPGVICAYFPGAGAAMVGASNVAFETGISYRQGTVGTTARQMTDFLNDPGGPERFLQVNDNAVPVDWLRAWNTCTPVGAAHTLVFMEIGAANNGENCDWSEPAVVKNRATPSLTWRRVGTAAAASTSTPSLSYTNVGNTRFSPAKGQITVRFAGLEKKEEQYIADYATEAGPYNCCTDPTHIWVSNLTTGSLTKRRVSDGGLVGNYALGVTPGHICYDAINNYIWVCDRNTNNVLAVNAATGGVVATYVSGPAGSQSRGICWDGAYAWVSNLTANTISKIRCSDGTLIGSYATALSPYFSCYANGSVWVGCYNGNVIRKLTAATGAFVGDYAVNLPAQPCYDGTNIWVTSESGNIVRKLTEATGAFVADYATGAVPSGCVYDGTNIWVGNTASRTVVKLLAATGALVQRYAGLGANPFGMAWDGVNMWVSIDGGNVLSRIGAPQTFLSFGADGAAGALVLDYAGGKTYAPLRGVAPQLRLRIWDDLAALYCDLDCGALTAAEAIRTIEWDAALGKVGVFDGATVLASQAGIWTPEPNAITPIYVGSDTAGANAAGCLVTLLEGWDF